MESGDQGSSTGGTGGGGPLDAEQRQALSDAQERAGDILKATKVATFNAYTIGFFAAVSLLFGIFSLTSLLVGSGLAVVARNEWVGRNRARDFQPEGFELMWRNQLGFMGLIIAYCLWSMYRATTPDAQMQELTQMLGEGAGDLVRDLSLLLYGLVIVATVIFQGLNARFYKVRVERLAAYVKDTPSWILELQRSSRVG